MGSQSTRHGLLNSVKGRGGGILMHEISLSLWGCNCKFIGLARESDKGKKITEDQIKDITAFFASKTNWQIKRVFVTSRA